MTNLQIFEKLKESFPNLVLPSKSQLNSWLKESIPIIINDWLIPSKTLKSCGVISSAFSEISCSNGFPIVMVGAPRTFL